MGVRLGLVTLAAALVVFLAVQDREMGRGAGRYVTAQRAAMAGRGPAVTIDEVIGPAVRQSVRRGLVCGALVGVVGLAGTVLVSRRSRRG